MTRDEHIARHKKLHEALDELVADFITHNGIGDYLLGKVSIMRLIEWSCEQTKNPTESNDE